MDLVQTSAETAWGETTAPLPFESILYEPGQDGAADLASEAPSYFRDLVLDQIVAVVTAERADYDLVPFYQTPLTTVAAIRYRQAVMRDLESAPARACIDSFAAAMRMTREQIAQANKLHCKQQKERWFLHAVETYCAAVRTLATDLPRLALSSAGLIAFREYVIAHTSADRFLTLCAHVDRLHQALAAIRYEILIQTAGFKVRAYTDKPDYSEEVAATFSKFRQGAVKDYRVEFHDPIGINHIEAKILEFVALLNQEVFDDLAAFVRSNQDFADPRLLRFDREIKFYLGYLDAIAGLRHAGLPFCYPTVSATDKSVQAVDSFDLALAAQRIPAGEPIVPNDILLQGTERILVVSGPNQGGKTTFARMFGQVHHLASIGCPVPGRQARLFLFDAVYTHFERQEDISNLRGKLQDDLLRMHAILADATPRSLVIINEIFSSTTLHDAVFLAREVIGRLSALDLLGVCVTFLDELATFDEKTVSMVSTVMPDNPAVRTFKVLRRPADGRAYAMSLAERYRLTYAAVKARIADPRGDA